MVSNCKVSWYFTMVQLLWIIGRLILDPIIGIASLPLSVRANDDDGFIGVNYNLPHKVETYYNNCFPWAHYTHVQTHAHVRIRHVLKTDDDCYVHLNKLTTLFATTQGIDYWGRIEMAHVPNSQGMQCIVVIITGGGVLSTFRIR